MLSPLNSSGSLLMNIGCNHLRSGSASFQLTFRSLRSSAFSPNSHLHLQLPHASRCLLRLITRRIHKLFRKLPGKKADSSRNRYFEFAFGGIICSAALVAKCKLAFCENIEKPRQNRVQAFRDSQTQSQTGPPPEFDWRFFFAFLKPDAILLIGAIACSVCLALINTQIPILLGKLVDIIAKGAAKRPSDYFNVVRDPVYRLCAAYFAQAGFTFLNIVLMVSAGERLAARLRTALFANLIRQDVAFFDTHKTAELVGRLSVDVQNFKSSFKQCFITGFRTITQTVGCAISLYATSPTMAGALLIGLPCLFSIGSLMGSSLRSLSRKSQAQVAHATDVADEALSHIRTVKGFAAEGTELHLYSDEVDKSKALNQKLGAGIGVLQSLQNLAFNAAVLAVIFWGGSYMAENKLQPGELMAFMVTSQTLQKSLASLSMLFGQGVQTVTSGARIFEYLKLEPVMINLGSIRIPYHSLIAQVTFKNVSFTYPSRPDRKILQDLNLTIPAGQVTALCGPSGSGKSTIAALLERFYDPDSGEVYLDDKSLKSVDASWLRGRVIGYISQEPTLFATSVLENIRYGRPDATDQEVYEAAKTANVDDFVRQFPDGYNTVLGERGVTVSGGQKQRIAIARALLKNPSILILDEATSALDSESEKFVQEALDKAAKGRTVLVIAHRLSTIQNANSIALIVNGKIAEIGDHNTLMKRKGLYWQFVQHQSRTESAARSSAWQTIPVLFVSV